MKNHPITAHVISKRKRKKTKLRSSCVDNDKTVEIQAEFLISKTLRVKVMGWM